MTEVSEALFIGGRSGVGKTTVAYELHSQLAAADVRHCLIEGDNLDMAHPAPWEHGLAEKNLTAMWNVTAYNRLAGREAGSELDSHYGRSETAARDLDLHTPPWVHRVKTDDRSPAEIAKDILVLTGWQH